MSVPEKTIENKGIEKKRKSKRVKREAAKPASVRLDAAIIEAAEERSKLEHRSLPRQISLWAEIGRLVSDALGPQATYELLAGTVAINAVRQPSAEVSLDQVLRKMEDLREDGSLKKRMIGDGVIYEPATDQEGLIRRVDVDGSVSIGLFENGTFVAQKTTSLA